MKIGVRLVFVFVLLMAALPLVPAAAQEDLVQVEIAGVIQAVSGTQITVNGQVIETAGAEISAPLTVGTLVKVEGVINTDGVFVTREVNAEDDYQPGKVEIQGRVDSFDGTTLIVGGQTYVVTGAELYPGIEPGAYVEVTLNRQPDGTTTVVEVGPVAEDDRDDDEDQGDDSTYLVGTLEEIGDGYIVVSGQRIDTTLAEFYTPLIVGGLVEVELRPVGGQFVATEVYHDDISQDDDDDYLDDEDEPWQEDDDSGEIDDDSQWQEDDDRDDDGNDDDRRDEDDDDDHGDDDDRHDDDEDDDDHREDDDDDRGDDDDDRGDDDDEGDDD